MNQFRDYKQILHDNNDGKPAGEDFTKGTVRIGSDSLPSRAVLYKNDVVAFVRR